MSGDEGCRLCRRSKIKTGDGNGEHDQTDKDMEEQSCQQQNKNKIDEGIGVGRVASGDIRLRSMDTEKKKRKDEYRHSRIYVSKKY